MTIISDASYDSNTRVGGYGYWIVCNRGKQAGGGPFMHLLWSSHHAETWAISRALFDGISAQLIQPDDTVLIQTDCEGAIHSLRRVHTGDRIPDREKKMTDHYRDLVTPIRLNILFRHVKGHTMRREARFAANRNCDKRAYDGMLQARELLRAKRDASDQSVHGEGAESGGDSGLQVPLPSV